MKLKNLNIFEGMDLIEKICLSICLAFSLAVFLLTIFKIFKIPIFPALIFP